MRNLAVVWAGCAMVVCTAVGVGADTVSDGQQAADQAAATSPWESVPDSAWESQIGGPVAESLDELSRMATGQSLSDNADVTAGCRFRISDLESHDMVAVTASGSPDPDEPTDVSVLTLSMDDYRCLYPQEGIAPDAKADLVDPIDQLMSLAAEAGGENLTRSMFIPDPDAQVQTGEAGVSAPAAELLWLSQRYSTPQETSVTIPALSVQTVEDLLRMPVTNTPGQVGGRLVLRTYLPMPGDHLYPSGGCNATSTSKATSEMTRVFGNVQFDLICLIDNSYKRWDTGMGTATTPHGRTNDDFTLIKRLRDHVSAKYPGYVDAPNELVTTYVYSSDSNGIALQATPWSLVAERADGKPNAPQGTILLHELGHDFGATHYPDDGWRKYVCNNNGVYFYSVMNYCYMWKGWMKFDSANGGVVSGNIW